MKLAAKGQLVLPGEPIATLDEKVEGEVYSDGSRWRAAVPGIVEVEGDVVRLVPRDAVYMPNPGDLVVGYVRDVVLGGWVVDIRAPLPAILPIGEAATRYINIDEVDPATILAPGDTVIARVIRVDPGDEYPAALTLIGEGLGRAADGVVVEFPAPQWRRVAEALKRLPCTSAVGRNGRAWARCQDQSLEARIASARSIEALEKLAKAP